MVQYVMYHRINCTKNISSRFSSNSEANALELLENIEEIFSRVNSSDA